jgi:uncharacterized membrane protein
MRRWLLPLLTGVVVALIGYQLAMVAAPRMLMSAAIKRVGQAGMNRMTHGPLATERARAIVRPSPDLAYSSCPFDLSNGPVRVQVAPAPSVYWSLSVFDSRTDTAFVRNNEQTGEKPMDIILARPGQPTPAGREVVRLNGDKGIALVRILVQDRAQFPAIDAVRRRSSCAPL